MNINEVEKFYTTASREVLREHIAKNNDSGISNEVLTKIVEQANNPDVWEEVTVEQLMEEVRAMGYNIGS